MSDASMLLVLDLAGTFAFALNGALTAVRAAHLDIVGVITLGMITAVGGGIIRDVLLGALPPATFVDWRYLAVAAGGGLIAFMFSRWLTRFSSTIDVLDAAGLSLFAVTGAGKALELGVGPAQAIILGAVTGVGGGTVRGRADPANSQRLEQRTVRDPGSGGRCVGRGRRQRRCPQRSRRTGGARCGPGVLPDPNGRSAFRHRRTQTARDWARGTRNVRR
jgi:Glycine transporter